MALSKELTLRLEELGKHFLNMPSGIEIVANYSGYGGDGDFHGIEIRDAGGKLIQAPVVQDKLLDDTFPDIILDILDETRDGWRHEEGSSGQMRFSPHVNTLVNYFTENVITTEDYVDKFDLSTKEKE